MMYSLLVVGCGGFVGAMMRYFVWEYLPLNIYVKMLFINMIGCVLISMITALYHHSEGTITLFAVVGVLTSWTMIWRFIDEVIELWIHNSLWTALFFMLLMNSGCILAVLWGRALAVRVML